MINPFHIIKKVEQHYHLKPGSIVNLGRRKTTCEARAVAMFLVRQLTTYSLVEVAEHFDRDIGTVRRNCNKMVKLINSSEETQTSSNILGLSEFISINKDYLI